MDLRKILAHPDLRRELMVPTLQATQAREGIETTREQAERAYYVVSEGERAAFFDLEQFRGGKREPDCREGAFVQAVGTESAAIRKDVSRRDFETIEGAPLAYRQLGLLFHNVREWSALEPAWGIARQGKATADDSRWLRQWWEVTGAGWVPFAKGGDFCRFYYDVDLVLDWREHHREELSRSGNGLPSLEHYFKEGLTWPRRTQRGFNLRVLPRGCVFADKGPVIIPSRPEDSFYLLGVGNAALTEFILKGLTSFGSWEVGAVRRLPVPRPSLMQHARLGDLARMIHHAKASWDEGNEISTRFRTSWLLWSVPSGGTPSLADRLDHLAGVEAEQEGRIKQSFAQLEDEVYRVYGIPDTARIDIETLLRDRPAELLWPQMEGKTVEQKRMEHVFRLLSFLVKRVVEEDEDGVVPFAGFAGESSLFERVVHELQVYFPGHDVGQIEVEIANELKKRVKRYRPADSIAAWLADVFFEYHCGLYKNRPIFWQIASSQGTAPFAFGALVHYHRFDRRRMAKLRGQYLRSALDTFRREAALADREGRADARREWQSRLEEAQELDRRLQWVEEGFHEGPQGGDRDYRILTPWKRPEERPEGWDPDIDDGVKINIEPLQKAGVLRLPKVVR